MCHGWVTALRIRKTLSAFACLGVLGFGRLGVEFGFCQKKTSSPRGFFPRRAGE
jgi:hypothetical protein